jgi:hypothetical protein
MPYLSGTIYTVIKYIQNKIYKALIKYNDVLEHIQDSTMVATDHSNWCASHFAEFAECDCGGGLSPRLAEKRR